MNYPNLINRVLPDDIFVLGWTPVQPGFSARFQTSSRTYRYHFLKRDLDLEKMREAGKLLVGQHDFRNFCKIDVTNVKNFVRTIESVKIEEEEGSICNMCYIETLGTLISIYPCLWLTIGLR